MADDRNTARVSIIDPDWRGVLPLDRLHLPRRLRRTIRQDRFSVRINQNFPTCLRQCAEMAPNRTGTWINHGIEALCQQLFLTGNAHSVECYVQDQLVGGLYGITLGGAFFGESMFQRATNASKVALFHLCARLIRQGFSLLDVQFITDHLSQFGAIEIPRNTYLEHLTTALPQNPNFSINPAPMQGAEVLEILDAGYLQSNTHTS